MITYNRQAGMVTVIADNGTVREWPLSEFEADPKACVLATGNNLAAEKVAMLARIAALRWEATQFFTYNGVRTQADGAIAVVTAAVVARQAFNVTTPQKWKISPGVFVDLDTPALLDFGQALQTHVQSCFDKEAALSVEIASARTPEDLAAIDITRGWP